MREAHVPAEQPKAQEATRLPVPYAIPRRSGGAQGPTPAWPHAPVGLIWRVRDRATFAALSRAERHVQGPLTVRVVHGRGRGPGESGVRRQRRRQRGGAQPLASPAAGGGRTRRGGPCARGCVPGLGPPGSVDHALRRPRRRAGSVVRGGRRAAMNAVVDVAPAAPSVVGAPADAADPGVAAGERAPDAPVPFPPVVLGVRARGARDARCPPRPLAGGPAAGALPSLGRRRDRPRPPEHTFAHESRLTDA